MLLPGGGTGDPLIQLCQELKGSNAEVKGNSWWFQVLNFIRFLSYNFDQFVYLDLSPTSLAIAKARAELAGCTNVRWFQVGILLRW